MCLISIIDKLPYLFLDPVLDFLGKFVVNKELFCQPHADYQFKNIHHFTSQSLKINGITMAQKTIALQIRAVTCAPCVIPTLIDIGATINCPTLHTNSTAHPVLYNVLIIYLHSIFLFHPLNKLLTDNKDFTTNLIVVNAPE